MDWDSRERARQLISFDDMTYSEQSARPTDIDLAMDLHRGKVFIYGELKYKNKDVPIGQRWFFTNTIKAMRCAKLHALAMVLEHDIKDASKDIQAAKCRVREYLTTETVEIGWVAPKREYTCDEMIREYLRLVGLH